ncbi:MAG: hypothetical protein OXC30_05205 [Alphaproteobacteria bacterium]|nr:hypothetical protein [Alphaproteobacteria bacterium]
MKTTRYIQRLLLLSSLVLQSAAIWREDTEPFFLSNDEDKLQKSIANTTDIAYGEKNALVTDLFSRDNLLPFFPEDLMPHNPFDPNHLMHQDTFLSFLDSPVLGPLDSEQCTPSSDEASSVARAVTHSHKETKPQSPRTGQRREQHNAGNRLYREWLKKRNELLKIIQKHPTLLAYMQDEIDRINQTQGENFTFDNMKDDLKSMVRADLEKEGFTLHYIQNVTQRMMQQRKTTTSINAVMVRESDMHRASCKRWYQNLSETKKRQRVQQAQERRAQMTEKQKSQFRQKQNDYKNSRRAQATAATTTDRLQKRSTSQRQKTAEETSASPAKKKRCSEA